MTAGQDSAQQQAAVIRPREHVENARADAVRAATEIAAEDGAEPDYLISSTISWALGEQDQSPFTGNLTPGVGSGEVKAEIDAEIRRMLALAKDKLAAGRASYALGTDWHQGVIAALEWALGQRAASPMLGKARGGLPDGGYITIEQREAEDHLAAPARRPDIPLHFADGVACTCRWLFGDTTQPPVSDDD